MESTTVKSDSLDLSEHELSDALREAVEEEMEFLENREIKLVRMRANDDEGDVFQVTIHAGDEMYRMSEVAPGHVSRTVFRNPEPDDAMPYQDEAGDGEEEMEEAEGKDSNEETDGGETEKEANEKGGDENGDDVEKEKSGETENDGEVENEEAASEDDGTEQK